MNSKLVNNIKVGMHVTIHSQGATCTGTVISACDWGQCVNKVWLSHDWYIELKGDTRDQTCYWKQNQDGGDCVNAETGEVLAN